MKEQQNDISTAENAATREAAVCQSAAADPLPDSVSKEVKQTAVQYILLALAAVVFIYVGQIFRLPQSYIITLITASYGTLICDTLFYVFNMLAMLPLLLLLFHKVQRHTGFHLFLRPHTKMSIWRSLVLYACALVAIFVVSAVLGFTVKIFYDLGNRVTPMQIMTNVTMYLYNGVKLLLVLCAVELVQEAGELLYTKKCAAYIPWGGFAAAVLCGLPDVLIAYLSGGEIALAWLFVGIYCLYGVIYLITEKNFFLTFFVCFLIVIL